MSAARNSNERSNPGLGAASSSATSRAGSDSQFDPIELEVFKSLFHSIAEEMGAALRRTAFSPNIKERRDYSCAVFDAAGQAVAMGDHMPVHLGSMPMSVDAAIRELTLGPGDVAILNDPFCGGTHLPDITLVAPVYILGKQSKENPLRGKALHHGDAHPVGRPDFYVANRAHHADVGGTFAGSMGLCTEIFQEGIRIPPIKLVKRGEMQRDVLALILRNVRTPREREGDLGAQLASCHTGAEQLREACARYGVLRVQRASDELQDYSERLMRALLIALPPGVYEAEDFLDDDAAGGNPVRLAVKIAISKPARHGKAALHKSSPLVTVDFTECDAQVAGSTNAVEAIAYSACFYVFRCLLQEDVPATAGLMRPVRVITRKGTVVDAQPPAAVAGGNVEMSQRIVDVLLRALAKAAPDRVPAAAAGTMNNLTIGGMDTRFVGSGGVPEPFAYYETLAGGMGARPTKDGVSGVHTHMTNSLNTPAEALEYAYPLRVTRYSLRRGSGGAGKHRGGDGIVREIELLTDAQVTLLAERRRFAPYGLDGGSDGALGKASVIREDGQEETMPGKFSRPLRKGDKIRIESPGGGGWGK